MRISDWSSDVCSSDLYYLPIMVLAISDPLAALSGKKWPWRPYRIAGATKTILGSLVFFMSAFLIVLFSWRYVNLSSLAIAHVWASAFTARSEERRVGKECVSTGRSRCSPDH